MPDTISYIIFNFQSPEFVLQSQVDRHKRFPSRCRFNGVFKEGHGILDLLDLFLTGLGCFVVSH